MITPRALTQINSVAPQMIGRQENNNQSWCGEKWSVTAAAATNDRKLSRSFAISNFLESVPLRIVSLHPTTLLSVEGLDEQIPGLSELNGPVLRIPLEVCVARKCNHDRAALLESGRTTPRDEFGCAMLSGVSQSIRWTWFRRPRIAFMAWWAYRRRERQIKRGLARHWQISMIGRCGISAFQLDLTSSGWSDTAMIADVMRFVFVGISLWSVAGRVVFLNGFTAVATRVIKRNHKSRGRTKRRLIEDT